MTPWLGIALVLGLLGALLGLLRWVQVRSAPHPEIVRKILHVAMGGVTLSFPWLFAETWPVWVLAGCATLLFLLMRNQHQLQATIGTVTAAVGRRGWGELCFPWSVAIVFELAQGDLWLYVIPILLLTLADAVAAIIGVFYSHWHYTTTGGWKSTEGSLAFFLVAFLSTHIPLLLATDLTRAQSLLVGLTVGLLVMLLEGFAWEGWDNLLIPVGAFFLLRAYLPLSEAVLLGHLIATAAWVVVTLALRRWSTLNDGALLSLAFLFYLTATLGGWQYVLLAACLYVGYLLLWPRREHLTARPHEAYMVLAVSAGGLGLVWLEVQTDWPGMLFAFATHTAAQLAFIGVVWYRETRPEVAESRLVWRATWCSWLLACGAWWLLAGATLPALTISAWALVPIGFSTWLFARHLPQPGSARHELLPWMSRTLLGLLAAVLAWIPWRGVWP